MFSIFLVLLPLFGIFGNCEIIVSCPKGSVEHGYLCYFFINEQASFESAHEQCKKRDGRLTKVEDESTNAFLLAHAGSKFGNSSSFWIGGQLDGGENSSNWTWIGGSDALTFFNWKQPGVATDNTGRCIKASTDDGTWDLAECSVELPYVCMAGRVATACMDDWHPFEEHCYQLYTKRNILIIAAAQHCRDNAGYLASIHSAEENNFIGSLITKMKRFGVLIGLHKKRNATWTWTDGSVVDYNNWETAPGDDFETRCSFFYALKTNDATNETLSNTWHDIPCDKTNHKYVCKKRAITVVVTVL